MLSGVTGAGLTVGRVDPGPLRTAAGRGAFRCEGCRLLPQMLPRRGNGLKNLGISNG